VTPYFADKIAVVTGRGSGLGRALCHALARKRAEVVVTDIDADSAMQTADAVRAAGGRAQAERLDVSDATAFSALTARTVQRHGRIDLLFNNAGFAVAGDVRDVALKDWRRVVDVNLMGVIHGTRVVYPLMVQRRSGHIVNTASLAGLVGAPALTPYATTKAAVVGLSMSLRHEAATVARVRNADLTSLIPFKLMPVDAAAQVTLRGVALNRAQIVYPFYARLMWALYRISPALLAPLLRKAAADFERLRERAGEPS
jgi:NAD(P)-dependent dehydrogenase (short-subunit alcohol dehydrogenase family)